MDYPPTLIRLILFKGIVQSLVKEHQKDIDQYNSLLRASGLGEFALENLTDPSTTRKMIVDKTAGAVQALRSKVGRVNGVDQQKLMVMARGFDFTLRTLQQQCSDQSWVHSNPYYKSSCIFPYGETPDWPKSKTN